MKVTAIDERALAKLYELQDDADPDLVADLVRMFFSMTPARIKRIGDALDKGDARGIEIEAHDLKASSANLGALSMSNVAADLEKFGRKGMLPEAASAFEKLLQEYQRAQLELATILE